MPVYTYRREDGTTFDYRQKFTDEPLTADPETGQPVVRVIQAAGVIFKGSGFYVNDSKSSSRSSVTTPPKADKTDKAEASTAPANGKAESSTESKPAAPAAAESSTPAKSSAAAD